MINYNVYIGYDQREHIAAEVCKHSILKRADRFCPPTVRYLKSSDIPEFVRERETTQATDFTYTRFMIPFLEKYEGVSVFCDCDFIFNTNVINLIIDSNLSKPVNVVKHPPYIPHSDTKMDNVPQHAMPRKNWASLIVFNNAHPSNRKLTPEYVNGVMPGRTLHQFGWLDDSEIGQLTLDWNTLDEYYFIDNPKAIHYTDGGPWFEKYKHTMYSDYWWTEYNDYIDSTRQQRTLSPNP